MPTSLVSVAATSVVLLLFAVLRIAFPSWTPDVGATAISGGSCR